MSQASDDSVGGAVLTGSIAYTDVAMRISARRPSQAALEAGLEVDRLADGILVGRGLVINERDEIEVTAPVNHNYYGERFRILGVQLDSRLRRSGHTELSLSRIERSRSQQ